MFNQELFKRNISTSWLGKNFFHFEELLSTNLHAKEMKAVHGSLILADHQSGGRGQHQRKWITESGTNLTFSLIFTPQKKERFTLLTLACALAVSEVVNEIAAISTDIKWPNDVLYKGKKLCGILTESQFSGNKLERIIVGIGLNVNQQNFAEDIRDSATSLSIITQKKYSREELLAQIIHKVEYFYRMWNQYNPKLVKQINRSLIGYGEWVKFSVNNSELDNRYKFLGVNNEGALVALNHEMDVQTFSYEQVRVLK